MAYSQKSISWARRKKPVECSCGCGVIIMPRPAWYARRNKPPEVRFIRGHTTREGNADPSSLRERVEMKVRPTTLILLEKKLEEAITVECPRTGCGTRWQVSVSVGDLITDEGCSFCAMEDIIADRIAQGIPVWPNDELDKSEGAIQMSVRTYLCLKALGPHLQTDVPQQAMTLGTLAHRIKTGTFRGTTKTEAEVRDLLDQCGLSEEYF